MRTVTIRHGTRTDDGFIRHDETPSTYEEAERIAGRRLDRRRSYCIIKGKVCFGVSWSSRCGNCGEGMSGDKGYGCRECGYTGRIRQGMWMAIDEAASLAAPLPAIQGVRRG